MTDKNDKLKRVDKAELKGRMRGLIMFLPNMVMLLGRLLRDSRVPTAEKALFLAAIVYVISPIDFIPDVFPFIGQVDDVYVVALTLLRLVSHSDESIVRRHWSGGGDIIALANSIASLAPKLLPKRVTRLITSKVELAPAGKILEDLKDKHMVLVREIPADDAPEAAARSQTAH